MHGFAVIDSRPEDSLVAIWHTKRVGPVDVEHTNAVLLDFSNDPEAPVKVDWLTRGLLTVLTDGSAGQVLLPSEPLTVRDIELLTEAALLREAAVVDAVEAYAKRTRKHSLVRPHFPATAPNLGVVDAESGPAARALNLANYVKSAWIRWLRVEAERAKRTGGTSGMMPPELALPMADFPADWALAQRGGQ